MTRLEPLEFSFTVDCPVEHAFETWTGRINTWWPKDHNAGGQPVGSVFFEAGEAAAPSNVVKTGSNANGAKSTSGTHPPTSDTPGISDGGEPTQVDITFAASGSSTDVRIVHSGWHLLTDDPELRRKANTSGWRGVLGAYQAAAGGVALRGRRCPGVGPAPRVRSRPMASRMAATIAGVELIVGGSPIPLAPNGPQWSGSSTNVALIEGASRKVGSR